MTIYKKIDKALKQHENYKNIEVIPLWRVLLMLEHIESNANNSQEILSLCKQYSKIMAVDSFRAYE